jgi:SAM-dependent methyltransferase
MRISLLPRKALTLIKLIILFPFRKNKSFSKYLKRRTKSHISKTKLSYNDLRAFGKKFATTEKALIVYIEFPYNDLLPNADILPHYENDCERYYSLLSNIKNNSYSSVIATGLFEHLKNPERLLRECYRILTPGGKVYISASCTFSIHRGPDDYFHVTHFGMRELLSSQNWSHVDIKPSCGPFKTIGILLQRILLQCETWYIIRPFIELMAYTIPILDRLVIRQYCDRGYLEKDEINSMMPSNIQLIATK